MNNRTISNNNREHKAKRYNTKDYHNNVVKKRKKSIVSLSKTGVTVQAQPSITTFLVEAEPHEQQSIELKKEEYFKVPDAKKWFNIFSLCCSFLSIKTNDPNSIVGMIKKNALNNNIVKWTV